MKHYLYEFSKSNPNFLDKEVLPEEIFEPFQDDNGQKMYFAPVNWNKYQCYSFMPQIKENDIETVFESKDKDRLGFITRQDDDDIAKAKFANFLENQITQIQDVIDVLNYQQVDTRLQNSTFLR